MPNTPDFPETGQGFAVPVESGSEEASKDTLGYTNPNLHRRITEKDDRIAAREIVHGSHTSILETNDYWLSIQGLDSYRTVETYQHTEEEGSQFENEIP